MTTRYRRNIMLLLIAVVGGLTLAWTTVTLLPLIPAGLRERLGYLAIAYGPLRCLYASWQERRVLLGGFSLLTCLMMVLGLVIGNTDGALFTGVAMLAFTNVLWLLATRFRLRINLVPAPGRE